MKTEKPTSSPVVKKDSSRLLKLRNEAKKRKPHFIVKAANFSARVKDRWRYPRGRHSPIRQKHRGKPRLVSIGYGSPQEAKGLHHSGLEMVLVHNASELLALEKNNQGAVLSASLGGKKKLELLHLAQKEKITLLNVKEASKQIQSLEHGLAERKKTRKEKIQEKGKKKEEKEKRAAEKKKEEEKAKKAAETQHDHKDHDHDNSEHDGHNHPAENSEEKRNEEKKKEEELKEKTLLKRQ